MGPVLLPPARGHPDQVAAPQVVVPGHREQAGGGDEAHLLHGDVVHQHQELLLRPNRQSELVTLSRGKEGRCRWQCRWQCRRWFDIRCTAEDPAGIIFALVVFFLVLRGAAGLGLNIHNPDKQLHYYVLQNLFSCYTASVDASTPSTPSVGRVPSIFIFARCRIAHSILTPITGCILPRVTGRGAT